MSIKERLQEYCKERHLTIGTFCRHAGISQSYFNQVKNNIGPAIREKIEDNFKDLNLNWLLTGEGKMLVVEEPKPVRAAKMSPYPIEEEVTDLGEIKLEETVVISAEVVHRPNYDIKKEFLNGTIEGRVKPTQYIVPEHDIKAYTENDEMAPQIESGDSVLIRFLEGSPHDIVIFPGRMYFVDLINGGVVRYVYEDEDKNLILRSTNARRYPDVKVPRSEVRSISLVALILKRPGSMSEETLLLTEVLQRHDDLFSKMLSQMDKAGDRQDKLIEMLNEKK